MSEELCTINISTVSYEGSLFTWKGEVKEIKDTSTSSSSSTSSLSCSLTMTSGFHCSFGTLKALAISKTGYIFYIFLNNFFNSFFLFNIKENI